jgi:alginate O-acetyltransferase complex protein AlgI
MLFPTIEFALFFAVVFPFTWLLNELNTLKKSFLVAASYFFYAAWRWDFTLILFASSVVNFALALWLGRLADGRGRLAVLWLGIAFNLGVLGAFKYYNFFVAQVMNLASSLGFELAIPFFEVGLPIAISFLTFHALSYIIDVYHRKLAPTRALVDILLYISFFPHLIAGPIVRAKAFLEQTVRRCDPKDIRLGFAVFLIVGGLFKKVIVANYLATDFVDGVFRSPTEYSRLDLLLGMYAYAIEIYCDFSAYTDIAIGVANLLGYQFPQNFNQPYRARSVQDFWRRWHMTLSFWLRDYLYIPLGGNRHGTLFTCRNIMITMGLGGLWHGASWTFVIWGLMHGFALVVERIGHRMVDAFSTANRKATSPENATEITGEGGHMRFLSRVPVIVSWFITLHFICLTWVFFRAPSIDGAWAYLTTLVSGDAILSTTATPLILLMLVFGALTQLIPNDWFERLEARYDRASLALKVAVPFVVIFLVCVAAPGGVPPFIYFQF